MTSTVIQARSGVRVLRNAILVGTALGCSLGVAGTANAQNVTYSGPGDYTLTSTTTISGGPRTVDINVTSGNINLDLARVDVANSGTTTGAGIAANNSGPGNVTIRDQQVNATGTGQTYGIDARTQGGNIVIDSGLVTSNSNPLSRGIYAISANGNITINADQTNGGQRGIFTGTNAGIFPNVVTINSNVATANGTSQPNAIVGQGQTVTINSGTATNTNAAGNSGTAIFANAGTGGAFVTSGTATALGNNQSAIQVYSDGVVRLDSTTARTTQTSDGLSVQSGTVIAVNSGSVSTTGASGARGIVLGGMANGIDYTSAAVTSGTITTTGSNSYGIYATPTSGTTAIDSGSITTAGQNAYGIFLAPIGTGVFSGATTIKSGTVSTSGPGAAGMFVSNSSGAVTIDATTVTTAGSAANAIDIRPSAASTAAVTINAGTIRTTGPSSSGIIVGPNAGSAMVTVGNVSTANGVGVDARAKGDVTVAAGTTRTGAPASALVAISANGVATVHSTDLASSGGTAIFAQGLNSATVTSGTLNVTGAGMQAIYAQSAGGTNPGIVSVTSDALTSEGGGINAYGPGATVRVTSGTLTAGNATGIGAFGLDVRVDSQSVTTNGTGINAGLANGAVAYGPAVINSGSVAVIGLDAATTGAIQSAAASVDINSGTILNSGSGNRFGISAQTLNGIANPGSLNVRSGDITTVGNGAYGIQALVLDGVGPLTVNSTGTITTSGTTRLAGTQPRYSAGIIAISGNAPVSVTSNNITTSGAQSSGIRVEAGSAIVSYGAAPTAGTAPIAVASTGLIQTSGSQAQGIIVLAGGSDAAVTNTGTIATSGSNAAGIMVTGSTGATTIASNVVRTSGALSNAILATSKTGSIAINSSSVATSGVGSQGIFASTTDGNIAINSGTAITTGTGFDSATSSTSDAVFGYSTGAGTVSVISGTASAMGDYANAVGAVGGGNVTISSGNAATSGIQVATVYGLSRNGDVAIDAAVTTATGQNAYAVEGHANVGNLLINSGTASALLGDAIFGTAGGTATVTAAQANAQGDGGTGVSVIGGSGVTLDIGNASSTGIASTNGTRIYRADAINAAATNGAILASIGSASALGAGSDAIHLVANGTGGAVTATITGTVTSAGGTGLFIDPPGAVNVNVAAGASITGLVGIDTTGATNNITNFGSISGTAGPGIVANGATTLLNAGSIAGANNVAVQLSAANDSVTLLTGSSINGRVVGGGGTDAAYLGGTGTGTVAGFDNFDTLTVQSGRWTGDAANSSLFNVVTIAAPATLEVANGASGISGVRAGSFIDNGTLVVRSSAASAGSTFGTSTVGGTGSVLLTGAGTVTLDGTNTITTSGPLTVDGGSRLLVTGTQGGTIVTGPAGILQVGNGGTTGNVTGAVVDNGTLIVNRADDFTFAGALTGTGNFLKQGAGKVIFGTNYAFNGVTTIQAGSIKLATVFAPTTRIDLEGSGQLDLSGTRQTVAELQGSSSAASINIDAGSLTVNQDTNTSFAGSIVGNGTLTKTGTGRLNLTGNSTYAGPTTVSGGILAVNGSITSPVFVTAGGTLGGTGRVGSVSIGTGGTYAPGNSIGTQTVIGNVAFAAGSTYAVEVNSAGQSDRIDATGMATIAGGTVQVLAQAGTYNRLTDYTILTAANGVSGRFAGVTSNLAFLSPLLSYSANAVNLTLARNDIAFNSFATSPNQLAVANAITARGLGDALYNTVLFQSSTAAQSTFGQLSGELYASLGSDLIAGEHLVRDAVLDRAPSAHDGLGVWLQGIENNATSRRQANVARLNANRTAGVGGIDYGFGAARVGVHGGYMEDKVQLDSRGDAARIKTRWIGASAAYVSGPLSVQAGADYARHTIDADRSITVPGLVSAVTASPKGHSVELYGELAYAVTNGPVRISPFVRNAYVRSTVNGFAEASGTTALTVDRDHRSVDFASAGLRLDGAVALDRGTTFLPRVSLAYEHGFGDLDATTVSRIGGTGPAFGVDGTRLGKSGVAFDSQLELLFANGLHVGAGFSATVSKKWADYGPKATLGFRF